MKMEKIERKYKLIGGVVVSALVLIAIVFTKQNLWGLFENRYSLYVYSDDVMGVNEATPIKVNGYEVGQVKSIDLHKNKILVELSFEDDFILGRSDRVYTVQTGVFGVRYLEIDRQTDQIGNNYEPGDTLYTELITSSKPLIDSVTWERIEPSLKELSRTIGKALLEYGESVDRLK
ncbi:MAG: MCE family protein [Bacteroidetes bacterium]|nr:MAG: MCE family protein [Bacteroidota bacterium]